jgi:hypothetical protein
MGGLAVLLSIAAYVAVAFIVVRRIRPTRWKVAAVFVALLLPTADALVGRFYVHHLCSTEGGLRVHKVVDGVEGFLVSDGMPSEKWITERGFAFGEGHIRTVEPLGRVVNRISLKNGVVVVEERVRPSSKYRSFFEDQTDWTGVVRSSAKVEVIESGDVLAEYKRFFFLGGWAERFLARFSDAGPGTTTRCDSWQPEVARSESVLGALRPTRR